jgi:acylphosphatase
MTRAAGEGGPRRRVRVWIAGRVQGVAFRYATREEAAALGLGGWVRNLPDGRVEALFDGPAEKVEAVLRWCAKGPPAARVTNVETREEDPPPAPPSDFEIRL